MLNGGSLVELVNFVSERNTVMFINLLNTLAYTKRTCKLVFQLYLCVWYFQVANKMQLVMVARQTDFVVKNKWKMTYKIMTMNDNNSFYFDAEIKQFLLILLQFETVIVKLFPLF